MASWKIIGKWWMELENGGIAWKMAKVAGKRRKMAEFVSSLFMKMKQKSPENGGKKVGKSLESGKRWMENGGNWKR